MGIFERLKVSYELLSPLTAKPTTRSGCKANTASVLRLSLTPSSFIAPLAIRALAALEEIYFVSGNPISLSRTPNASKAGICVVELTTIFSMGTVIMASYSFLFNVIKDCFSFGTNA